MSEIKLELLTAYNQNFKQLDDIYHRYARRCGISDTVMWVLVSMMEAPCAMTQREVCESWSYTPQTVNSALKSMEKAGLLELRAVEGNRKSKTLHLTARGRTLGETVVTPLLRAEQTAFSGLQAEERERLVASSQRYTQLLEAETEKIHIAQEA